MTRTSWATKAGLVAACSIGANEEAICQRTVFKAL